MPAGTARPDERDHAFPGLGQLPLGGALGGVLGTLIGVRPTLQVAATGGALAFLPVFLSPLRRLRELPSYSEPGDCAAA